MREKKEPFLYGYDGEAHKKIKKILEAEHENNGDPAFTSRYSVGISVDDYNTHNVFEGISARDELFVADKIYRETGIPLAKNANIYGIDLLSLDPDRPLAVEVEGTNAGSWPIDQERPKHWVEATFVLKKLKKILIAEQRNIPSAYVKINHFQNAAYCITGQDLIKIACQQVRVRENSHSHMNNRHFVPVEWDDSRLLIGLENYRQFFWQLMSDYCHRKTKDPKRQRYMTKSDAVSFYQNIKENPIQISDYLAQMLAEGSENGNKTSRQN